MSLESAVLWGLLTVASIVQALLLARTMIAGRRASQRLAALEGDFRLMMARLPRSVGAHTATIDESPVALRRPVRFVGGLNQ